MPGGGNRVQNHIRKHHALQNGQCFWCGEFTYLRKDVDKKYHKANRHLVATFDHIIPASKGGTYRFDNGVCACSRCNNIRGDRDFDKFKQSCDTLIQQFHNRMSKKKERALRHKHNKAINCYLIARFAIQCGKTVQQLFDELVYNKPPVEIPKMKHFPLKKVNEIALGARAKFDYINYGGCGMLAYIFARQLIKVVPTRIVMYGNTNVSIDEIRPHVTNNSYTEWMNHGMSIGHTWVEFKVGRTWYAIDTDHGVVPHKKFRKYQGTVTDGEISLDEIKGMAHDPNGWNEQFDRDQIPAIKRFINTRMNMLFGV